MKIRIITVVVVCLCFSSFCLAANWKVIQLTDNDYDDFYPKLAGGYIAWQSELDGQDREIMYGKVGGSILPVTNNTYKDHSLEMSSDPSFSFPVICWRGENGAGGSGEIYMYYHGMTSPLKLTENSFDDKDPKCYGTHVVWAGNDSADYEIYHYKPAVGYPEKLTNDSYDDLEPVVHGNRIAWRKDVAAYGQDIFYHNGSLSYYLSHDDTMESDVCINDGYVVWSRNTPAGWEIMRYTIGTPAQITDNDSVDLEPVIFGDYIAWHQYDGEDTEIMFYDDTQIKQLTFNHHDDGDEYAVPAMDMDGDYLVWLSEDGISTSSSRIFVCDISQEYPAAKELSMPSGFYGCSSPVVSGDHVAWHVWDGHDYEIFVAIACDPMPGDTNNDCQVNLLDLSDLAGDWLLCDLPDIYCNSAAESRDRAFNK